LGSWLNVLVWILLIYRNWLLFFVRWYLKVMLVMCSLLYYWLLLISMVLICGWKKFMFFLISRMVLFWWWVLMVGFVLLMKISSLMVWILSRIMNFVYVGFIVRIVIIWFVLLNGWMNVVVNYLKFVKVEKLWGCGSCILNGCYVIKLWFSVFVWILDLLVFMIRMKLSVLLKILYIL